jgi:hypothetical protein
MVRGWLLLALLLPGQAWAVVVGWDYVQGTLAGVQFRVARQVDCLGTWTVLGEMPITTQTWTDPALLDGHTYCYRVSALSASAEESEFSNVLVVAGPLPPVVPTPPPSATCVFTWGPITRYKNGTKARLTGYRLYSTIAKGVYAEQPIDIPLARLPDVNRPSYSVPCTSGQTWMVIGYAGARVSDASTEITVP